MNLSDHHLAIVIFGWTTIALLFMASIAGMIGWF